MPRFPDAVTHAPYRFRAVLAAFVCLLFAWLTAGEANARPWQYFKSSGSSCPNQSLCEIVFPATPAGRVFEVTSLSCGFLIFSQVVEILSAKFDLLNGANQVVASDYLVPQLQGRGPIGSYFAANQPTTLFVVGGFKLRAQLSTDAIAFMSVECKVSGDLTP